MYVVFTVMSRSSIINMIFLLQILVEYDDVEWHRREWICIYKDKLFHLFLVEQGLVWVERRDPFAPSNTTAVLWPALVSTLIPPIKSFNQNHEFNRRTRRDAKLI